MSLKHPNAVQETTTVTGTGDAVLLGAALGRLPFNASVNNGDTVRIQIEGVDVAGNLTGEFEISLATYNGGPNSLTRSVVETSSNSNNLVVFSAGTKRVYACSPTNNDLTTLSTPAASALTGTTLAANVVTSSLTTIGTLVAGSIPYSLITGAPAAVSGANPTASVGLAAVNGSAATFLRSDGAPALSQAIVPTWTGLHTFQAQTSAQAAVFRSAQTTPTNTVSFSLFDGTVKSFVDANGLFTIGSANTGVASLDVSSAATTFPGNYSASCVLRGVFPALWLRGSDAAGIMFGYFGTKAMGIASTTVGGALDAYRMFFDTNGLVSINNSTTTPLAQLHVVASASTTGLLVQASTSGKAAVFKAAATTPDVITEWQDNAGTSLVDVTKGCAVLITSPKPGGGVGILGFKGATLFGNPIIFDGVTPDGFMYLDSSNALMAIGSQSATYPAVRFQIPSADVQFTNTEFSPHPHTLALGTSARSWTSTWFDTCTTTQVVQTAGSPTFFTITGAANTTLAASTEAIDVNINLARTVQFTSGSLTTQRAMVVQAPTYAFTGASTLSYAATVAINGSPVVGTNATITNSIGLWVQSGSNSSIIPVLIPNNTYYCAFDNDGVVVANVIGLGSDRIIRIGPAGYAAVIAGTCTFSGDAIVTGDLSFPSGGYIRTGNGGTLNIQGFASSFPSGNPYATLFHNVSDTSTSGTILGLTCTPSFAPTSGTATLTVWNLAPTVNQTGGANGITRGLYINPTLTAAADWRSLEINTGIATGRGLVVKGATSQSANLQEWQDSSAAVLFSIGATGVPKFGTNTTGAGTALISTNCPAVTPTAPYTWLTVKTSDGSTAYVPAWK